MQFERMNPITETVASRAEAMSIATVRSIAERAQNAFSDWRDTSPSTRREYLLRAAHAVETRAQEFVVSMRDELGATETWSKFNVRLAVSIVREAASLTTRVCGETIPSDRSGSLSITLREPAGVVLGIAPWNAPIILGVRSIAVPLACGNTVILKTSEQCPRTHTLIIEAFIEAGFPDGVVNMVTNSADDAGEIVGALIDHEAVRRVNFTGSTNIGRKIAKRCAKNLKPCLLELGGKAPFLVLESADIDESVKAAAFGAFMNQGQICMSTERIIVVDAVMDEFVSKFVQKAQTLSTGDPGTGEATLGAVADRRIVDHVNHLVDDAVLHGGEILTGGRTENIIMPVTVIDAVKPNMKIYHEESFGPIVSILRASDETEAIEIANDTEYGLTASVFSRDISAALRVARKIRSGMCHINGPTVHDEAQMPFGGIGSSGYGRFGGEAGVAEFTDLRWISVDTKPNHYPI